MHYNMTIPIILSGVYIEFTLLVFFPKTVANRFPLLPESSVLKNLSACIRPNETDLTNEFARNIVWAIINRYNRQIIELE